MIIKTITIGPLEANCYIIGDENTLEAAVIDPGDEPDIILESLRKEELKPIYLICTHAHFDHIGAIGELKNETGAKILIHKDEKKIYDIATEMAALWGYEIPPLPKPDIYLNEGDILKIGSLNFKVIHTPGHSPGGICLYGHDILITGDTLFAGSVGRTDFYGGNLEKLKESFMRLLSLPEHTQVFPGHGPKTTIKIEKKENFFIHDI